MPRTRSPLLATLLAIVLPAVPVGAQTGQFYRGRTVTIIVSFSPGGGYDLYARAFARHLPDHVPGRPTVHPVTGGDTARIVAKLSAVPAAVISKAKQIYQ